MLQRNKNLRYVVVQFVVGMPHGLPSFQIEVCKCMYPTLVYLVHEELQ